MGFMFSNCKIAYGTTRTVLLVGKLAFKIPSIVEWRLFLLGLVANMQECRFYARKWPELCPVLWSIPGGWLVVMRRAIPLTRLEFDQINTALWLDRGDYVIPAEPKMDSFGWIGDNLVVVDYGN